MKYTDEDMEVDLWELFLRKHLKSMEWHVRLGRTQVQTARYLMNIWLPCPHTIRRCYEVERAYPFKQFIFSENEHLPLTTRA